MNLAKSILLFIVAAFAEIGGAWLIWQGVREHRGLLWIGAGVIALGLYGFVATLQPDANFGRILAAYGGIFVAGSLAWGHGRGQIPSRSVGHHRRDHLSRRRRRDHVRPASSSLAPPEAAPPPPDDGHGDMHLDVARPAGINGVGRPWPANGRSEGVPGRSG